MPSKGDVFCMFLLGIAAGCLIVMCTAMATGQVSIDAVGRTMCNKNGLEFVKSEHIWDPNPPIGSTNLDFKIYCTNQTKLEDGYLILLK